MVNPEDSVAPPSKQLRAVKVPDFLEEGNKVVA